MPLVHIVSLVVCVIVTVPEDDEPHKVDFVFISISGEFTQTFHWYSITNYILLSFSYHIYLSYVFIYIHIDLTYLSIFFHVARWIFWYKYILYTVFQYVLSTWCSICCDCTFQYDITCCFHWCYSWWGWWT